MTVPIEPGKVRHLRNGKLKTPVLFNQFLPRETFEQVTEILKEHSGFFHPIHREWLIPTGSYQEVETAVADAFRGCSE